MRTLVDRLRPLKNPWICAHGRPTMRYLVDLHEMRAKHLNFGSTWRHRRKAPTLIMKEKPVTIPAISRIYNQEYEYYGTT